MKTEIISIETKYEGWARFGSRDRMVRFWDARTGQQIGNPLKQKVLVRACTVAMIEDLGHVAIEAASAADALEVLRSKLDVDIVITDYAMPEMNGGQLATEIHRFRPHVPVGIATGYAHIPDNALSLPR